MDSTDPRGAATAIAEAALDRKALDVVALDVGALTSYADALVIATGTSNRHTRSIADGVFDAMAARGLTRLGVEGYDEGRWILIDGGEVIVHVFQQEVRENYDLERLWSDAPRIALDDSAARRASP